MSRVTITLTALLISLISCEEPASLEAISGVEGQIHFDTAWPDSLIGATVVVFDLDLELDSIDVPNYPVVDHFITYGDPVSTGTEQTAYFIQLEPGGYLLMVIGLLIDPAQLVTNAELMDDIQNYIVIPENSAPRGIVVSDQEINTQSDWFVHF